MSPVEPLSTGIKIIAAPMHRLVSKDGKTESSCYTRDEVVLKNEIESLEHQIKQLTAKLEVARSKCNHGVGTLVYAVRGTAYCGICQAEIGKVKE